MPGRGAWGTGGPPAIRGTRTVRTTTRDARRTRAARLVLAVPLLAVALAGCGIRATEVPTDFGPAPSRVPCTLTDPDIGTQSSRGILIQVFLLCSSQLASVDRTVRIAAGPPETDRVRAAQALLDELSEPPSDAERQAHYTTDVPQGLTVSGPNRGAPGDTLRLSTPPADLSSYALAQIICTFSDSAAASDDGTVTLGGPGTDAPRRYRCTPEVRSRPGTETPPSTETEGT